MQKVLIPYAEDLNANYIQNKYHTEPVIFNKRYFNLINIHNNLLPFGISYDEKYLSYINNTNNDIAILLTGGGRYRGIS